MCVCLINGQIILYIYIYLPSFFVLRKTMYIYKQLLIKSSRDRYWRRLIVIGKRIIINYTRSTENGEKIYSALLHCRNYSNRYKHKFSSRNTYLTRRMRRPFIV